MKRPVGVTILAVIAIIYGIFSLLLAFLALVGIGFKASGVATTAVSYGVGTLAYAAISDAILGILYFVFGIGAFRLKGWAWTAGVVALVLDLVRYIVGDIISGFRVTSLIGLVALVLLWYLFRPNVRAAFGKAA